MKYFVYIIYSESYDSYYRGYSTQPEQRLKQHNEDKGRFTKNKGPWNLVFLQSFSTKREALIRERKIKKYSKSQIIQLIASTKNEIK
ncbi:endonuclease [Mesonia sp. HuA40]|nr:endonuclease [Mesonia sp. HuA40]